MSTIQEFRRGQRVRITFPVLNVDEEVVTDADVRAYAVNPGGTETELTAPTLNDDDRFVAYLTLNAAGYWGVRLVAYNDDDESIAAFETRLRCTEVANFGTDQ